MSSFYKKVLTWYCAYWVYRKIPYGEICCCGADLKNHSIWDNHSPRDAKEYAVTQWVEEKLNSDNNL